MKLFNSMSRKKEEFVPITPGEGQDVLPAAPRSTTISTWATPAP